MRTIKERLDYTIEALSPRGLAPLIFVLCDVDFRELAPEPKGGGFYYKHLPVERSAGGISFARTYHRHAATVQSGQMVVPAEPGEGFVWRDPVGA